MNLRPTAEKWVEHMRADKATQWFGGWGFEHGEWIKCFSPLCSSDYDVPDLQMQHGSASASLDQHNMFLALPPNLNVPFMFQISDQTAACQSHCPSLTRLICTSFCLPVLPRSQTIILAPTGLGRIAALASLFAPSVAEGAALVRSYQSSAQTERIDMSMHTVARNANMHWNYVFFFSFVCFFTSLVCKRGARRHDSTQTRLPYPGCSWCNPHSRPNPSIPWLIWHENRNKWDDAISWWAEPADFLQLPSAADGQIEGWDTTMINHT